MVILSKMQLPATPVFQRPPDLAYAASEQPPGIVLFGLALQHAATALALIAYVLATAKISGLSPDDTRSMITATIIGMALATFFQSWGGRLGSGMLIVHIPSPLLIVLVGMTAAKYGLGGLVALGLANGLAALGAGYLVPRLRPLLPPTVAGVVVCVAGLSLITPAVTHLTGFQPGSGLNSGDMLAGGGALAVITALSIWGSRRIKLFALLAGLVTGVVLAAGIGQLGGLAALANTPVFGLPSIPIPVFQVDPGLLLAVIILALMTQLDTFGTIVLMHKMEDSNWKRPDMRLVAGGIKANALGNLLGAWLGAYPSATSSANLALCHISRSTSRYIGLATAAVLMLFAFLPQVSLALTLIPTAVIGAVEIYAAAYLVVSGIELIASRALDSRGIFMVGLAFVAGLGVMLMPDIALLAPESIQFLTTNGIIVAGFAAIVLNMLFRLGISQRAACTLDTTSGSLPLTQQVVDFVESQGAIWSARRDAVRRAAQAALEASEAIQASGAERKLFEIRGHFDEFNLNIELLYHGPALVFDADRTSSPANLLDIDDDAFTTALDQALSGVSHTLLKRLADKLSSGTQGDHSYLRLHFEH
ncbi:hypothetical protein H0A66_10185 [Alcaligenaceae bacterium]|nr:hypothetical protein [Alcaligenaceae bacterium]